MPKLFAAAGRHDRAASISSVAAVRLTTAGDTHRGSIGPRGTIALLVTVAVASTALASSPAGGLPAHAMRSASTPARGTFGGQIEIGGGRKLYLRCAGVGSPTVVLESGYHDSSDPWTLTATSPPVSPSPAVFHGIARYTHVCMYDRPGTIRYTNPPELTTRSTPVWMPRTLRSMAADLHALLQRAGVRGRVVLVGHSFGGLVVRLFAQSYRSRVAGLVLVDAFGVDIKRLFGAKLWPPYVELLNHPGTKLASDPHFEVVDVDGAIKAVQAARPLPRVPLAVISKTRPFATGPSAPRLVVARLEKVWPEVQNLQVKLEPQTPHVFATGSDHYVQIHDPDLVINIVRLIVDRVRG